MGWRTYIWEEQKGRSVQRRSRLGSSRLGRAYRLQGGKGKRRKGQR
jgi:hypothetical protein